jgi:hypothetical protein
MALLSLIFLAVSCTKNHPEKETQITQVNSYVKDVSYSGDTATYTYLNSPISAKLVRVNDYTLNVDLIGTRGIIKLNIGFTNDVNGIKNWVVSTPEKEVYYSFKTNSENLMGEFKITKDIPYEKILPLSALQSIQVQTFSQCMASALHICGQSWVCSLMCGTTLFGIAGCAIGLGVRCAAGN